jgi:hypothetical protein
MTHDELKMWMRRGFLAATPFLTGCWPFVGGSGDCGKTLVAFDGSLPDGGQVSDAGFGVGDCEALCGSSENRYCSVADAGLLSCQVTCVGGRAAPGMAPLSGVDATAGSWVARMAELEGAAVHAFAHLADELHAHGLKAHARYALKAASQEVRHAQAVTRLALGMGHCPAPVRVSATPLRSLEEVAIDNAGEGCARELFGTLINEHQARAADNADVRRTMAAIALDEARHARFSFALARAVMPRLSIAQRKRAREAQERTLTQLGGDEVPVAARKALGLMDAEELSAVAKRLLETARI